MTWNKASSKNGIFVPLAKGHNTVAHEKKPDASTTAQAYEYCGHTLEAMCEVLARRSNSDLGKNNQTLAAYAGEMLKEFNQIQRQLHLNPTNNTKADNTITSIDPVARSIVHNR